MSPRPTPRLVWLARPGWLGCLAACGSPKSGPEPAAPQPAGAPAGAPAAAAPALDPPQPALRLPRNFLPTGYRARLALDPAKDGFEGQIQIAGDIRERSKGFWLHGRNLKVSAARITRGEQSIGVDVAPAGE